MAVSPDGRLLATATEKPGIQIAEIARPDRATIPAGFGFSSCVAFSHDGKLIAGGRVQKQFWIAPAAGKSAPAWPLISDSYVGIDGLDFSPDDSILATCGGEGLVCLWEPSSGALLRSYRTGARRLWGVAFSPDGRSLATCGTEGTVQIWDATIVQDAESTVLPCRAADWMSYNLSPKTFSAVIRTGREPDKVRAVVFDLVTNRQTAEWVTKHPDVNSIALSPDHSRIATCRYSGKNRIDIVSIVGDAGRRSVTIPPEIMPPHLVSYPTRLAFSPDGTVLAAAVMDLGVVSWEVSSGRVLASIPGMPVNRLTLSPNGDRIATEIDGRLHVWDSAARSLRDYPRASFRPMDTIVFSPDGAKVAAGYHNDAIAIAIWDVGNASTNPTLIELSEHLSALAFSPDGKVLAAGNSRGQVILIDLETQRPLITLEGPRDAVIRIAFSPDGRTILAFSQNDPSRPPVVTKWTGDPSHRASLPTIRVDSK